MTIVFGHVFRKLCLVLSLFTTALLFKYINYEASDVTVVINGEL